MGMSDPRRTFYDSVTDTDYEYRSERCLSLKILEIFIAKLFADLAPSLKRSVNDTQTALFRAIFWWYVANLLAVPLLRSL